ncbi:DNA-directed DNA polymerase [Tanacetum coccineum]
MNKRCSAVLLNKLPSKEKDPGSFTIPCDIGHLHINNALADLGASISLMPYTMYEKLGLGEPKPTRMSLELADRSIQYPRGIAENIQSTRRPPTDDDECYGIDFLDTTIHSKTQELLEDDQLDSFLVNNLEESIDLSNSKNYGIGKMQGSNSLEDVRHKRDKSVILHTQDLNGGKDESFKPAIQPQ